MFCESRAATIRTKSPSVAARGTSCQDGELVTSDARDEILIRTGAPLERRSHGREHAIAFDVPSRIVDTLEVVHVDHEEREAAQSVLHPFLTGPVERPSTGHAGQGIDFTLLSRRLELNL